MYSSINDLNFENRSTLLLTASIFKSSFLSKSKRGNKSDRPSNLFFSISDKWDVSATERPIHILSFIDLFLRPDLIIVIFEEETPISIDIGRKSVNLAIFY